MPLSQKEISDRAYQFASEWAAVTRERAESQTFWNEFFNVFGFNRRRIASFEEPVKKLGDRRGSIDLFWKGTLLVEHKSKGQDLDKAVLQAFDYFPGLKDQDLPKYVLVSDFARFRLYDLEESTQHEFTLAELHKIYRVIPDEDAAEDGDFRVVDESGEDYLYPANWPLCHICSARFGSLKVLTFLFRRFHQSAASMFRWAFSPKLLLQVILG